jgi:hypothetical protein
MDLFLTAIITLAIIVLAIRHGDLAFALLGVVFWSSVLLLLIGAVAVFVWSVVHG